MSKPIFYERQKVGCLLYGEGVVKGVVDGRLFSVLVGFEDGVTQASYTQEGYLSNSHHRPVLYPLEQYRSVIYSIAEPQPEAWKPKVGEWYWFWDTMSRYKYAVLSTLESYHANDPYPFATAVGTRYKNCAPFIGELPEHLKKV